MQCSFCHAELAATVPSNCSNVKIAHLKEQSQNKNGCGNILLMTPEVFDKMIHLGEIRRDNLRLLLADDIQAIGEDTLATYEAVIARVLLAFKQVRILAMIDHVGNIEDFKFWLKAKNIKFNDEHVIPERQKRVLGFESKGVVNHFQFENRLTVKLPSIMAKNRKESLLIICSTGKSAEITAAALAKTSSKKDDKLNVCFSDSKLDNLAATGIAFLAPRQTLRDRRMVELLFSKGKIRIICLTLMTLLETCLSAHSVIVKGTKKYGEQGFEEYSVTDLLKLTFRAKSLIVIMTSKDMKSCYSSTDLEQFVIESRYIDGSLTKFIV